MITIKRLTECTIEEGVQAWNVGFEGYYFDATTTAEKFVNRLVLEGLSLDLSIVAFQEGEPIGIIKNGVRLFNKQKIAWNGGTGVASHLRNKGVGRELMEATLSIYKEEGVHFATLEAISDNKRAIALYEKMGYRIVDDLEYLELKGIVPELSTPENKNFIIERVMPQQIGHLSFYKGMHPWQTSWQSAKDGEGLLLKDFSGEVLAYAYYRRNFDEQGKHVSTVLFQCEANPTIQDGEKVINYLIHQVFSSFHQDIRRVIPNLPTHQSNQTYSVLKNLGFKPFVNQVFMMKEM
ncbi:GNAT family N-acetyltransferase [Neobacillus sp. D3-1R]|uniref:GNAT family N-acetyltransferase n=1 Tax=Neobacillus sp. D3-1R TaxID=3445778 RepID=UPI003FA0BA20